MSHITIGGKPVDDHDADVLGPLTDKTELTREESLGQGEVELKTYLLERGDGSLLVHDRRVESLLVAMGCVTRQGKTLTLIPEDI